MGKENNNLSRLTSALGLISLGCITVYVLLVGSVQGMLISASSFIPAVYAVGKKSSRAALIVDLELIGLLIVPFLFPSSVKHATGALDMVRLIMILGFHEFFSLSSESGKLNAAYRTSKVGLTTGSLQDDMVRAYVNKAVRVGIILSFSFLISEIYLIAAQVSSASLTNLYAVALGLMLIVALLFILIASPTPRARLTENNASSSSLLGYLLWG